MLSLELLSAVLEREVINARVCDSNIACSYGGRKYEEFNIYELDRHIKAWIINQGYDISCGHTAIGSWCQLYRSRPKLEQTPCTGYFHGRDKYADAAQWVLDHA